MQAKFSELEALIKALYNDHSPKISGHINLLEQELATQHSTLDNELSKYGNPTLTKKVDSYVTECQNDLAKASHIAFNKGSQPEILSLLNQAQMDLSLALSAVEQT